MNSDAHQIISRVYEAKTDSHAADQLISDYMPFIKSETARFINRPPDKSDDELSIAMFAFYEAIHNYSRLRGSFLKFAALHIRNRLIDNYRKEKRNKGQISLDVSEDDKTDLRETIRDDYDAYEENELREATKQEIAELSAQMQEFGVSMSDVADNSPRQRRTLESCQRAVRYARSNPDILEEFLRTKRVPLAKLAEGADVERKTLERHRRYLVAVLLICTNGYEIMRGHIMQVLKGGEKT
ncbi:sigma-70 family RNA polymerase sigma factor [Ruminococcus sp.]|uniref:sigma-70 family RNA polymerase sigma factor n=1 Tax=Ruminococcus sp. TaxID=41978 RepID=UPI0025F8C374|nr:sigma-70 family RNA polymerase sigma factor [Ruminococcus sp.]MBQ6251555.1 sigma-70 family RNA polymerase sigma factor [Ruminococcus sp.]MBR3665780.1 sigma-70 family RNA polymerase sigma factor [Ruminococcus sp.]MBR6996191.1 sigma-70 family RNA polymerase sigma factor [Ruminococcus sp.]